ncbi:MAG: PilN domain-containing protein, partial [Planctomycetota bacterium]
RETERKNVVILGGVLAGTVLLTLAVHAVISSRTARVTGQVRTTQAEIDELSEVIGDVASFKKDKEEIEEKLAVIQALDANRGGPVHILDELASRLPEKLWLTRLAQESGALTLEGFSIDNETIATYMTRLAQSPYLRDIELERSELQEGGAVKLNQFTIRCSVVMSPEEGGEESGA